MKKYFLILIFCLINALGYGQRQIPVVQHTDLWHKVQQIQQLHFAAGYNNPRNEYYKGGFLTNLPSILIDDKRSFSNPISYNAFDEYTMADIDRIEYIEADPTQQSASSLVNMLYAGGHNGVIFIYTKQFINTNPAELRSGSPAYMGYPNLVKRAYTKP